jgi:hypothetical protein
MTRAVLVDAQVVAPHVEQGGPGQGQHAHLERVARALHGLELDGGQQARDAPREGLLPGCVEPVEVRHVALQEHEHLGIQWPA